VIPAARFATAPASGGEAGAGKARWMRVGRLDDLRQGDPRRLQVVGDERDAFTLVRDQLLGSVWIVREGDKVRAMSATCPHLGCAIDVGADRKSFACPCHASRFALTGATEAGPSPRGMDALDTDPGRLDRGRFPPLPPGRRGARGGRRVSFGDWLNERTGHRALLRDALDEPVPGGARLAYVWGSALTLSLVVQVVTGWLLMSAYAPSATTAWSSVAYITYTLRAGWLIRGLHHFGAQAMVILLALHLLQTAVFGAYRKPGINWLLGLGLSA
jgi:nitrite reductase/ring-hydroxylating ferredoxin subunit